MTMLNDPPQTPAQPAPLRPDYEDKGTALSRLPKLPFELLMLLVIVMLFMGAGMLMMRSSISDARAERDAVAAERAAAQAEADALGVELDAADQTVAQAVDTATADASVAELEAELDAALDANDDLVTANEAQQAEIDELTERVEAAEQAPVATPAPAAPATPVAPVVGDAFAQYVGELVGSADGLRMTPAETQCLGRELIAEIGLDKIGAGMSSARTAASNDVVIAGMFVAAEACGIDPSRIFTQ
jgi:Tfp pilus assembly protein PilX